MKKYIMLLLGGWVLGAAAQSSFSPRVSDVYPEPDTRTEYNLFTYPEVMVHFNREGDVRFEKVFMRYASEEGEFTTPVGYKEQPTLDWRTGRTKTRFDFALKEAVDGVKESMRNNSVFTLVVAGPTIDGEAVEGQYVDSSSGNIEFSYFYSRLTGVKEVSYPDPVLSYWPADSDGGKIVVELDGAVAPLERQSELALDIFIGDYARYVDSGEDWPRLPSAPVLIDGRRLEIDLRGVLREPDNPELDVVTVRLFGLVDEAGKEVDFFGGNLLQIINIPYENLRSIPLMYEFWPVGGSLAAVETVELWMEKEAFRRVRVEGFRYEIGTSGDTVEYSLEDVVHGDDPVDSGSYLFYVPVPEAARAAEGEVKLSAVLTELDGYDDVEMAALYLNERQDSSGVEGIGNEERSNEIYTIDGRPVKAGSRLIPGLYVTPSGKLFIRN